MHRAAPYLALLVVAILTGCGSGDGEGGTGTSDAGAAPSGSLTVSATDFAFAPADLTAEAGEVTIELVNDGQTAHALAVAGNGVEATSDTIGAGETTTLTVELADGVYDIWCPVEGHADLGMDGTLTVGAGGGMDPDETETETGETETGESSDDSPRY